MLNEQVKIMEALEQHFAKCWLGIDFDYREIMPERIAYILKHDVTIQECHLLARNYRKHEIVYRYTNMEIFRNNDYINHAKVKHLSYKEPFDTFLIPKDALLQLPFNN